MIVLSGAHGGFSNHEPILTTNTLGYGTVRYGTNGLLLYNKSSIIVVLAMSQREIFHFNSEI